MKYDYLIVGAGFAGATIARKLAEENKHVLIIDRRDHIGGNSYDYYDKAGILVHKYGPHYFRTNDSEVWDFLSRFTEWRYYQYIVKSFVDGQLFDFPINLNTINQFYGTNFSSVEAKEFIEKVKIKIAIPKNSEEQIVSQVGQDIYEKFFKNYTIKQWKTDPKKLDASITARIPIRFNKDPRYFSSIYQAMPKNGYHKLFENLLNHNNIDIKLNNEFTKDKSNFDYEKLIFTGCIDEFFNYKFGKLGYISLKFEFETFDKELYQNYSQINYPNEYDFTRIVEIKHATGQKINKTTIVREYPKENGDPYYPILNNENAILYEKYLVESQMLKNIYFVGRLAQFKYLNMDQTVREALSLFNLLIKI
jgi:UDP-galactopyranose mutase